MRGDSIQIDQKRIRSNFREYIQSVKGDHVCEHFDTSLASRAFGALFALIIGLILVITIVKAADGLKTLFYVFSLQWLRGEPSVRDNPDSLKLFIGYLVIIGPDDVHSLALGTFVSPDEYSADRTSQMASKLGKLYASDKPTAEDEPTWKLLRDDVFISQRRRKLPEPWADGKEFYLFDVEVNLKQVQGEKPKALFAASGEESGLIMQLPWSLAKDAVTVAPARV